jgi:hypothetical protein
MGAELTGHLGYEKNDTGEKPTENRRNGSSSKTVRSDQGPLELEVPRDRDATFEPKIVEKQQREFAPVQRQDSLDVRPGALGVKIVFADRRAKHLEVLTRVPFVCSA